MRLSYANVANKGSMTQALTRLDTSLVRGLNVLNHFVSLWLPCAPEPRTTHRVPNTSDEVLGTDHKAGPAFPVSSISSSLRYH